MFNHILVATDGSPQAERAVALAAELSAHFGSALCIVHALPQLDMPAALQRFANQEGSVPSGSDAVPSAGAGSRAAFEAIGRGLLANAQQVAQRRGAVATTTMQSGDPARVILDTITNTGADAVVLGRRGIGEAEGVLLGSVSHKIAQLADITCVTVK